MSLNSKIVCYWPLDETSSETPITVEDYLGNKDLFCNKFDSAPGKKNGCLFNSAVLGDDSSIFHPNTSFGFSCWIKVIYPIFNRNIISKGAGNNSYKLYVLGAGRDSNPQLSDGDIIVTFEVRNNNAVRFAVDLSYPADDDWHLICCWVNREVGKINISIDGNTPRNTDYSGVFTNTPIKTFIIRDGESNLNLFIDEVGLYHDILTPSDLDELWNGGNGRFPPFPENIEDEITFSDQIDARHTIKEEIEDEITFPEQIDARNTIRKEIQQNIFFTDLIISPRKYELEVVDEIVFTIDTNYDWNLLLEDGSKLLLEDGGKILLEFREHNFHIEDIQDQLSFTDTLELIPDGIDYVELVEDTITFADVNSHQHKFDSVVDSINFSDNIHCNLNIGNFADTITFTDSIKTNIHAAEIVEDVIQFNETFDRNDIIYAETTDLIIFNQVIKSNLKSEEVEDNIIFFDTIQEKVSITHKIIDSLIFIDEIIGLIDIKQTIQDTITFNETTVTNFYTQELEDTVTFTDSIQAKKPIRLAVDDTITFNQSHSDIHLFHILDFITFNDFVAQNNKIAKVEDVIIFFDNIIQHGSIYVSINDAIEFEDVIERNIDIARYFIECLCFEQKVELGKHGDIVDSIVFSDSAEALIWEIIEDTIMFEQEFSVEGIDFADYPCAIINQESTEEIKIDGNKLVSISSLLDPQIIISNFQDFQGVKEERHCSSNVALLYQVVTDEIVFNDKITPFGDRGIEINDALIFNDFIVGFKIQLR